MGRMKEHPRYNVLSFRVSDEEFKLFNEFKRSRDRQSVLHQMLVDKIGGGSDGVHAEVR